MTDEERATIERAFEAHHARTDEVLSTGDAVAIKQMYIEFGRMLEAAGRTDLASVPLLSYPEIAPAVAELLADVDGVILDAGCGPLPATSIMLGREGRTIVAMDISHGTTSLARAVSEKRGMRLMPVVGDLEALPFVDGAFDAVACEDTIEHVPHDALGISEIGRVLRPGGRCILTTPNRTRAGVLALRARDRLTGRRKRTAAYYAATSHLREYTWQELEALVRPFLVLRRRESVPWSGGIGARIASTLVRVGSLRRLGRMVVLDLERPQAVEGSTEA